MKINPLLALTWVIAPIFSASAATTSTFNGLPSDTPVTLQAFGDPGGPSINPNGGFTGAGDGGLVVTPAVNGQNNYATFNRTNTGTFSSSSFSFQFRVGLGTTAGTADGVAFAYLPSSTFGISGPIGAAPFGAAEDPSAAGVLGFGLDTWSNNGSIAAPPGDPASPDDPNQAQGSNYSEISLFYNGTLINRVNDTRLLPVPFALDDGNWHTAFGTVNFAGQNVSMTVDNTVIWNNIPVPGLTSFEARIAYAGRTGGENEIFNVDNVNVDWIPIPEPASAAFGLLGLGLILRRRRK